MNRAEDTLRRILREKSCDQRTLITLDGPCASGKTTMAERFSSLCGAPVIHTDEFVVPHSQKTAERLAIPGGNCDAERLVREPMGNKA